MTKRRITTKDLDNLTQTAINGALELITSDERALVINDGTRDIFNVDTDTRTITLGNSLVLENVDDGILNWDIGSSNASNNLVISSIDGLGNRTVRVVIQKSTGQLIVNSSITASALQSRLDLESFGQNANTKLTLSHISATTNSGSDICTIEMISPSEFRQSFIYLTSLEDSGAWRIGRRYDNADNFTLERRQTGSSTWEKTWEARSLANDVTFPQGLRSNNPLILENLPSFESNSNVILGSSFSYPAVIVRAGHPSGSQVYATIAREDQEGECILLSETDNIWFVSYNPKAGAGQPKESLYGLHGAGVGINSRQCYMRSYEQSIGGATALEFVANNFPAATIQSNRITNNVVNRLWNRTTGNLPVSGEPGDMIFVTNEAGGAVPAFYDGTNWRRVTDRAIVS